MSQGAMKLPVCVGETRFLAFPVASKRNPTPVGRGSRSFLAPGAMGQNSGPTLIAGLMRRRVEPTLIMAVNSSVDANVETNPQQQGKRQLVVAVDDSDESVRALLWTVDNFYRKGDVIHLLHVIPFLPSHAVVGAVYYSPPPDGELQERLIEEAEQFITDRFKPILNKEAVDYRVDLIQEESSETISEAVCHAAITLEASAIVVAAHKKSTLAAFLTGSSSREVAGKSDLPVLVFHG